ncbi:MAG: hypothetical protein WCI11_14250 [Candidatus Methylumidiphilus sp.]
MNKIITKLFGSPSLAADGSLAMQTRWITGQQTDIAMTLSWIPFSLIALAVIDNPAWLKLLMFSVFLFSFTHQPLSLFLVYGDRQRFELRRNLFIWSPLVFCLVIFLAINFSPLVIAILAGAWNVEHTLMQRYGITRIYGRMVGQKQGGSELPVLFAWLTLAVLWSAYDPNTMERVAALGIRGANLSAFAMMTGMRPTAGFLLVPALLTVIWLTGKWLKEEYNRPLNQAKHYYLASTLGLFIVMLINPIVGFIGYVGSHAFEYFMIINQCLEKSYIEPKKTDSPLGWVANSPLGRYGLLACYLSLIVLTVFVLENYASFIVYSMVFFTLGALHFFYDGFIWKLRNPVVAQSVGVKT